jgi:hypothetical protein
MLGLNVISAGLLDQWFICHTISVNKLTLLQLKNGKEDMTLYVVRDEHGRLIVSTIGSTSEAVEDYMVNHYHGLWDRMKAAGARIVKSELREIE